MTYLRLSSEEERAALLADLSERWENFRDNGMELCADAEMIYCAAAEIEEAPLDVVIPLSWAEARQVWFSLERLPSAARILARSDLPSE